MSTTTLRPNVTGGNSGVTLTGAASIHAALSDNSDASHAALTPPSDFATVGLDDFTLPAGHIIRGLTVRLRAATVSGGGVGLDTVVNTGATTLFTGQTTITGTTPTTQSTGSIFTALTDSEVDAVTLGFVPFSGATDVRLYEAYVDVTHVAKPVVTVTGPSSPVTNTNRPTVTWSTVIDSDGGNVDLWQIKIFTSAQYGAGGFSPDSSTAFEDSGVIERTGAVATSYPTTVIEPNGTYRAYVRVAQQTGGVDHWSDWAFAQYTVNVAVPAAPLINVTGDEANGRFVIELDDQAGAATTDVFEVERSIDGGTTYEPVRQLSEDGYITPSGGLATTYDYEAPIGQSVTYRARGLHNYSGVYAAGAWATDSDTIDSRQWWLKHPHRPDLNLAVTIQSYSEITRAARQGIFQPLGSANAVVITDTRGPATGVVRLLTTDPDDRTALDALLDMAATLFLHGPVGDYEPDRYVRIGDQTRARGIDKSFSVVRTDALSWVQVAEPSGVVVAWP